MTGLPLGQGAEDDVAGAVRCLVRPLWDAGAEPGGEVSPLRARHLRQGSLKNITGAIRGTEFHAQLVYDGTVDFPAVTICSLNPYKFSELGKAPELSTLMSAYNFFSQTRFAWIPPGSKSRPQKLQRFVVSVLGRASSRGRSGKSARRRPQRSRSTLSRVPTKRPIIAFGSDR